MSKSQKRFFKLLPQAVGMVIAAYKGTDQEHKLFDNQFLVDKASDLARRFIHASQKDTNKAGQTQGTVN